MSNERMHRRACVALGLALVALSDASAEEASWRVKQGEVRVVCPMTVGGSFVAETSTLDGVLTAAPSAAGALAGGVSVDLKSLDTGIGLRNDHLRSDYLEVEKGKDYAAAVLTDIRIGDGDLEAIRGKARFTGTLLLHGTKRAVSGEARIRREGANLRVEAGFPLLLADFGIAEPRYLGIGVKDEVEAKVQLELTPDLSAGVSR